MVRNLVFSMDVCRICQTRFILCRLSDMLLIVDLWVFSFGFGILLFLPNKWNQRSKDPVVRDSTRMSDENRNELEVKVFYLQEIHKWIKYSPKERLLGLTNILVFMEPVS